MDVDAFLAQLDQGPGMRCPIPGNHHPRLHSEYITSLSTLHPPCDSELNETTCNRGQYHR